VCGSTIFRDRYETLEATRTALCLQNLFSLFIVPGAPKSIRCCPEIQNDIGAHLDPPFEELFDEAEEYILTILFEAWSQIVSLDQNTVDKVRRWIKVAFQACVATVLLCIKLKYCIMLYLNASIAKLVQQGKLITPVHYCSCRPTIF
jgi:hypothetical protein